MRNSVGFPIWVLPTFICLLAAAPAYATTVMTREYVCPYDGTKFKASLVGSSNYSTQTLALRPTGTKGFPARLPWRIAECPTNGFLFLKSKYTKEELERLRPLILSPEYQALRKQSQHYRKKWILERTGASHLKVTLALLSATWQNFQYANELVERLPQDIAEVKGTLKTRLKRLRGDLLRRLGRLEEARKQFEEIVAEEGRFTDEGLLARYELKIIAQAETSSTPEPYLDHVPTVAEVLAEFKNDPEVLEATQVPTLAKGAPFRKIYVAMSDDMELRRTDISKLIWLPSQNAILTNAKDGLFVADADSKKDNYIKNIYNKPHPKWWSHMEYRLLFATQKSVFVVRDRLLQLDAPTLKADSSTTIPCGGRWATVLLLHDEQFTLCLLGGELVGRNIATRKLKTINFLPKKESSSFSLKASDPSGPRIAYVYRVKGKWHSVVSWDYEKNVNVAEFSAQGRDLLDDERYWVGAVDYSRDGQKIFVAGYYITSRSRKAPERESECEISVRDVNSQNKLERKTMSGRNVQLAIDPAGQYAALACDRTINVYDAKLKEVIETMKLAGSGNVLSMAFSSDGKKFAVRTARAVSVYAVGD